MEKQTTTLDIAIFAEIHQFMNRLIFQDLDLDDLKLTKMEILIILIVASNEGISMTELAKQVGTSKVQISRSIASLEERQIVKRQNNQKNRRIVNVFTTAEGKALFAQKEEQVKQKLAATLAVLNQDDYASMVAHFAGALEILRKYKKIAPHKCKENPPAQ